MPAAISPKVFEYRGRLSLTIPQHLRFHRTTTQRILTQLPDELLKSTKLYENTIDAKRL